MALPEGLQDSWLLFRKQLYTRIECKKQFQKSIQKFYKCPSTSSTLPYYENTLFKPQSFVLARKVLRLSILKSEFASNL